MTPSEVADLLSLSVELDRYATADKMTKEKVVAWAAVLNAEAPGMSFGEAQQCVIRYYGTEGESLTVYALIDLWKQGRRLLPHQIAADVRSAKARGLIDPAYSHKLPLPVEVAERLAAARAADRSSAVELSELEAGSGSFQLEVGRRL